MLNEWLVVDCSIAPKMNAAYIERASSSCVDVFNWTVCSPHANGETAEREIEAARRFLDDHRASAQLACTMDDVLRGAKEGRPSFVFGPQNALPIATDFSNLDRFFDLGVRILQLTYNDTNAFGCGCLEAADTGLTPLGRVLIREIADRGMVLDLSHAGSRTALEAIEATPRAPIISHGNSRSVEDTPRNFSDEVIVALAERGGVIGLTLWSPMVGSVAGGQPTLEDWLRHLDYVLELVGPDHVGFGSDHSEDTPRDEWERLFSHNGVYSGVAQRMGAWYGYETRFVERLDRAGGVELLFTELRRRHYEDDTLRKVAGANFLRVFEAGWSRNNAYAGN